jgi:hypothetical protein
MGTKADDLSRRDGHRPSRDWVLALVRFSNTQFERTELSPANDVSTGEFVANQGGGGV